MKPNQYIKLAAVALIAVLLFCVSYYVYIDNTNDNITENQTKQLAETVTTISKTIKLKIDDSFSDVKCIAGVLSLFEGLNKEKGLKVLSSYASKTDFISMSYITSDKVSYSTSGETTNISSLYYYAPVFAGKNVLDNISSSDSSLCFITPITKNGEFFGAVSGTLKIDEFEEIIDISFPSDKGEIHLFDPKDGRYVLSSGAMSEESLLTLYQFLGKVSTKDDISTDRITKLLSNGESVSFTGTYNGDKTFTYFMPLGGDTSLYIMAAYPFTETAGYNFKLFSILFILGVLVYVIFVAYSISIIKNTSRCIQKSLLDLQVKKQQHDILFTYTNYMVFEFDIKNKKIIHSSEGKRQYGFPDITENVPESFIKNQTVHPDDTDAVNFLFSDCISGKLKSSCEARIRDKDGNYIWNRITISILPKSIDSNHNYAVGFMVNIQEKKEAIESVNTLREQAKIDSHTKLYNKRAFENMVTEYLEHNDSSCHAMMMIDIDRFKTVNDNQGHPVGDRLLSMLGDIIRLYVNPKDLACRAGGDEFIVFFKEADDLAIVESIAQVLIEKYYNSSVNMTGRSSAISVGLALYPCHGKTFLDLYKNADSAMYHSKSLGGNTYTIYSMQTS